MSRLVRDANGNSIQIVDADIPNIQTVAIGASSVQTAKPMPGGCTLAVLWADVDCCFNIGTNPTAAKDSTSIPLSAKTYYYQPVTERTDIIAFIQYSSTGTAWVIPAK